MAWENLGQVNLSLQWQLLDEAVIGGEVFRIRQTYSSYPIGYALLSFVYADGGRYGYRRFYPDRNQDIMLLMPVPEMLIEKGLIVRYPTLKISGKTRIHADVWTASVDLGNFENDPVVDNAPIDGGTF